MEKIEHFSHTHPLALKKNDGGQVSCCGCEEPVSGPCYCCSQCNYVLHKSCATLPLHINDPLHPLHPLTLLSSSPYSGRYICDACKKVRSNFVYHCSLCSYDLDIPCASLYRPHHSETAIQDEEQEVIDHSDLLESHEGIEADHPKHFMGHGHALTLITYVEGQSIEYADKLCDACIQPIKSPLFACAENCGFLLHQSCAELPRTKQHRFHPHRLTLFWKAPHYDGIYRCDSCKSLSNGFVYRCDECQFDLDVCCGLLPETMKHESHKHPLVLEKSSIARLCKGCNLRSKHVFVCDVCEEFAIDSRCATLPSTAWHMYDKHPLRLNYAEEEHLGERKCGICKEKRCRKQWFYYCDDCDFVAHTCCVVGKSRRVKFGGSVKYDYPSHALTFVEGIREQRERRCDACGEGCVGWGLECGECKFWVHREGDCFWEQFKQSAKYLTLPGTMRDRYAANLLAATPKVSIK